MKTALITGTSSGIGLELIKKFDKEGIRTISLSRSNIVSDHEFSSILTHINFDITIEDDINSIVDFLSSNSLQVDFLINNAGKLVNKPFLDQTLVDFKSILLLSKNAPTLRILLMQLNIHNDPKDRICPFHPKKLHHLMIGLK